MLSRSQFPPGGWQFYQSQTRWKPPTPTASTFDQTVTLIIKHRLANRAIAEKYNLETNALSVGEELEAFTKKRLGMPDEPGPKTLPLPLSAPASGAVAAVKKLADGAGLLLEWEEAGMPPVARELAEKRAAICVTCPKNSSDNATEWFTRAISAIYLRRLEKLNSLKLTTPNDDRLGVCAACLCPLKLKVHTPMELIEKRLKPGMREELDPRCWILAGQ